MPACHNSTWPGLRSALAVGWLLVVACGGAGQPAPTSPSPPETATLIVVASTSGARIDPDGYSVSLDGIPAGSIDVGGSRRLFISAGTHTVGLDDAWVYCAFDLSGTGRAAQVVTVAANATDTVRMNATCSAQLHHWILFESNRDASPDPNGGLLFYAMHTDGSGPTLLSPTIAGLGGRVSPDGQRVAYIHGISPTKQELWVMDADGSNAHLVPTTANLPATIDWSHDGTMLAFADVELNRIHLIHPDGTGDTVVPGSTGESGPAWSPDGTTLAVSRFSSTTAGTLYTMATDGSALTPLTTGTGTSFDGDAVWSPDGSQLAFVGNETGTYQLYTINPDGTGLKLRAPVPGYTAMPTWSPDGTKIAFMNESPGHQHIWVAAADGSNAVDLTPGDYDSIYPSWAP